MAIYPSRGFIWRFSLTGSDRTITGRADPGPTPTGTNTLPSGGAWKLYNGGTSLDSIVKALAVMLNDIYNDIHTSGGDFTTHMNKSGYIEITNNSAQPIYINSGNLIGWLGFPSGFSLPVDETVTATNMPKWLWAPRFTERRDTGDKPSVVESESVTQTERPNIVEHSDPYYWRLIAWQMVASPFIHQHRANDANFAAAAEVATGDPHCALENLIAHTRSPASNAVDGPQIWVLDRLDTAAEPSGPYYFIRSKSALLQTVQDELLNTATALESFVISMYLRKGAAYV